MSTWTSEAPIRVLVFGLGYTGLAVARAAVAVDIGVSGTVRAAVGPADDGIARTDFVHAHEAVASATHLLSTVPPDASGDPVLRHYQHAIEIAPRLRWIGYLSTTGVYGDRNGAWVDEQTLPAPTSDRGRRRLAAEENWRRFADRCAVDVFRLAGIYGPQRSAFDDLRAGTARRVGKPGHSFGRIHRDDIVRAVMAAMRQDRSSGLRILNLADDEPAETSDVVVEAARLLGVGVPEPLSFEQALATMSPMARSFWAENRKVSSRRTQQALGLRWLHPSYREGLRAILAEERGERPA
ncbi:MAG TPA: SDR family NAD(P)-dependent oxidoreductase [Acetobacteraceae bacterium]|nr:SDR family NAD(P)-dependent oxidoreductase [Acetobacteraceae bacterium]